jgi:4-amino-4-deoxy-L-arabinose transferase-like glycosyltransferase
MRDAVAAAESHRRRDTLIVVGIVAVGTALRVFHLGAPSLWLDEALSIAYARLSWPQFVHLMATRELNMLPYYLLLRIWIHLGTQEWIVRSLSVICSVATLPMLYRLGARLFGERVGQISVALLAVHPYHIRFAQEARGYSLMLLLLTASTLLLVRATDSSSRHRARVWVAYVVTSALAVYSHFYASLAILAQWASFLIARPRALPLKSLSLSIAGMCILLVPLAAFVLLGRADPAGWIPNPNVERVEFLIYSLLGGDNSSGARVFAYPAYAAAIVASGASVRATWRVNRREQDAWQYGLVATCAILPILVVLAVSLIKPIFVDKYLIECLPFAVLLLAVGLERLRPRALSLGALLFILGISTHALVGYYRQSDKDDWRAATRYVLASARAGDAALFFPSYVVAPFDYYRASADTTASALAIITLEQGRTANRDHNGRLWALFNQDGDAGTAVRDSLSEHYRTLSDRQFTGVRVVLYDTR